MNFNSLLANIISRINLGNRHKIHTISLNYNKITLNLIIVMVNLGLLRGLKIDSDKKKVWIYLRFKGGAQIFYKLTIVSKPSKRIYWNLRKVYLNIDKQNSLIFIISTKEGLLLGSECIWRSLTGEVIAEIEL